MADVSFSAGSDEECEILVGMVHDRLPREYAHQPIRIVESDTSDENHSTTASEEESTAEEATENRLASVNTWCRCGMCESETLGDEKEAICCLEVPNCVKMIAADLFGTCGSTVEELMIMQNFKDYERQMQNAYFQQTWNYQGFYLCLPIILCLTIYNIEKTKQPISKGYDAPFIDPDSHEDYNGYSEQLITRNGSGLTPTAIFERIASQVNVKVQIVFLKLGDIDTVNELFNASIFVQARWSDPSLDDATKAGQVVELSDPSWVPKLSIQNAIGQTEENVWYMVSYNSDGFATVSERRTVKGKFYESMELADYPFDSQDLTITVTTARSGEEIRLFADDEEKSSLNDNQEFTDAQEWNLFNYIVIRIYNPLKSSSAATPRKESLMAKIGPSMSSKFRYPRPQISVSCKALRRWEYYAWNVILIMLLIGGLVFTTFAVDCDNTPSRLQMSFVLLLSNITFKMAVGKNVPQVSYLTRLDKYIIASLFLMSLVCIWHSIVGHLPTSGQRISDFLALTCLIALWLANNILFFLKNLFTVKKKEQKFSKKIRESIFEDDVVLMDSTTGSNIVYAPTADRDSSNEPDTNRQAL
ncbi:hypothetical protein CAPTEDRAFT_221884 [Capitella teleta]|uniref:Neurotransmitter-gated ion-channel ligand-binding domain-containing protein n=1 Tax=Capitella teleta TaxID=283909 RepID=R7T3B9_CAPTE|nr:hypothetical protein CAPTEDRAFT_221884 [Capitella teleta]|eukprot:ELT87187.1 hypothetical protein CAPTEDRAFT_221884 [Capitella teleta]